MSSFATLVAIIAGLSSQWVTRAMQKSGWSRVGLWEKRMLKDLKMFVDNKDDFVHLRHNIAAIVDAKPQNDASVSTTNLPSSSGTGVGAEASMASVGGKGKNPADRQPPISMACVPFIGVYLAQLKRANQLPDMIDPTAPEEPIGMNPATSNLEPPSHPEVFSALQPLPEGMNLEPLINVQKQRRIAAVIKGLVAAQHVASRIQFGVDHKLFQKCLKLSGLEPDQLLKCLEGA
jgi:Gdp/GTP exchange factor required for growth at low temperatures